MTYSHVPGDKINNAPPSKLPKRDAPPRNSRRIRRQRVRSMDDPSEILRRDGVAKIGPISTEVTKTFPDPKTLKAVGFWARWTRYRWDSGYDALLKDWEGYWLPRIELLQNKSRRECMLVSCQNKPKGASKYQPELEDHDKDECWVAIVIRSGPGLPLFSKGSHIGNVNNPYLPLESNVGDIVLFMGNLYRQEPEVKGDGCLAVVLRYC